MRSKAIVGFVAIAIMLAACSDGTTTATVPPCGPGTSTVMGVCIPSVITCGMGTHRQSGMCVADTASTTVVQTGMLAVPPAGTQPSGWETALATRLGVTLNAQLDSRGPDAWSPAEHPLVMVTSVGPGYGGFEVMGVRPGVAIIDGTTGTVVADSQYSFADWTAYFEPHGLCVSPGGEWIYLPTGDGPTRGRFLIINARTLRVDKILATRGRPHHCSAFTDMAGRPRVLLYGWDQPAFILDPADNNRVVGGVDGEDTGGDAYLWFVTPDGSEMWGTSRHRRRRDEFHTAYIMRVSTATWRLIDWIVYPQENTPVWVAFSANNRYAYVTGGHTSTVLKYDRMSNRVLAVARSGVEGPYGVNVNWDGTRIYTIGKGEGSHNQGREIGVLDTVRMETVDRPLGQFLTNCLRGDHASLHPDPMVNELWVTCNSSFELIRFSLDPAVQSARQAAGDPFPGVLQRIPMPHGGSTHSGAFVRYTASWGGEVVSDHNGLHGAALATQAAMTARPITDAGVPRPDAGSVDAAIPPSDAGGIDASGQ